LLTNKFEQRVQRCVPKIFLPIDLVRVSVGNTELATRPWDVHLVALYGIVIRVVAVVRYAPAEVGCPQ
jgi:hypothetical protein